MLVSIVSHVCICLNKVLSVWKKKKLGFTRFLIFPPAFREVFDLFDSNGGGTIDAEELDLALKSVDIHLSQEDLQEVLGAMDKDGKKLLPKAIQMIII